MWSLTKVDEHGVVEYKKQIKVLFILAITALVIALGGYLVYLCEVGLEGSNVASWSNGSWTVWMVMTTIGFGDYFPVSAAGRVIASTCFVSGAILLGTLLNALQSDSGIQNRELRTMLAEVMRKLEELESHLDIDDSIDTNSHNLDRVIFQEPYESSRLNSGYLTMGQDSSGCFILSVEAYYSGTTNKYRRWIPCRDLKELTTMFDRYKDNYNEL